MTGSPNSRGKCTTLDPRRHGILGPERRGIWGSLLARGADLQAGCTLWVALSPWGHGNSSDREVAAQTHISLPAARLGSARRASRVRSGLMPRRSTRVIRKTECSAEPLHLSPPPAWLNLGRRERIRGGREGSPHPGCRGVHLRERERPFPPVPRAAGGPGGWLPRGVQEDFGALSPCLEPSPTVPSLAPAPLHPCTARSRLWVWIPQWPRGGGEDSHLRPEAAEAGVCSWRNVGVCPILTWASIHGKAWLSPPQKSWGFAHDKGPGVRFGGEHPALYGGSARGPP